MRLIHLLPVLSTVFALPTSSNDPSTTDSTISDWDVGQWTSVHGLWTGAERLSGWSWMKAEKMLGWNTEQELAGGGEEDLTIWERLKQDPHSFSRLVKVIEVSCNGEQSSRRHLYSHACYDSCRCRVLISNHAEGVV